MDAYGGKYAKYAKPNQTKLTGLTNQHGFVSTDLQYLRPLDLQCEGCFFDVKRLRGLRRGCVIFQLLIWLKQSTSGSPAPEAMFINDRKYVFWTGLPLYCAVLSTVALVA